MKKQDLSRRSFLKFGAAGLAAIPVVSMGISTAAAAERLDESAPEAQALNYKHDTTQVDHPAHSPDQKCINCLLYTDPSATEWGACAVFPNKLVAANGWCTAYVARG
ncbi:Tat (twin-arginine translocation) pathway signal sequence [Ectothiorhodospira magna]|uniref:Tat (Twin-arginine translocation) pathway signal sequence n=1 Tax=Ectothiorhodospira magna TaxID=867345 RepID=A0A1H8Z191_9GAMM|nr:high-potential iron-sulfur protein [Ectothiorhodospira magna]SEP58204.1 Tat (twin-arginine translocation) pathway signal sequence [Ectothiorhodospira magna]